MWQDGGGQDDLFSGIDTASVKGQRLPYLLPKVDVVDGEPGLYVVEIEAIKIVRTREKRVYYCAEFLIVESNVEARPPGLKCSWMTDMAIDMGPINVKRFLGALDGRTDEDDIDRNVKGDDARLSVDASQPFSGCQVFVQVRTILTKGKKENFSEHRWEPVVGFTLNDILNRREAAAANLPAAV